MGAPGRACRGAAWVLAGAVLALPLVAPGGPLGGDVALAGAELSVSGDVSGLLVGRSGSLALTVTNASAQPVVVRRLDVDVRGGGACGPAGLVVAPWRGTLTVPGRGSAVQVLTASVRADAACAGVSWELGYRAAV